jgi:SpoIID/LytB domain protein
MRSIGGGRWRPQIRVALVTVVAVASCAVGLVALPSTASAYPSSVVSIQGHGYGHGYGMGQWGALGYAINQANYPSILGIYYGGTTLSTLSAGQENPSVRVDMTENDGNLVIVTSATPFTVAGVGFTSGQVALMTPVNGSWVVWSGPSCQGPWVAQASGVTDPTATPSPDDGTETLTLCLGGSGNVTMHGSIEATYNSNGAARTVNEVPLEQYVDGVVPNESPSGWGSLGAAGPQGQPWGFQELEAQAVAVRSYVMAGLGSYGGYADTCDLSCQTYRGTLNESSITDQAGADTTGQVMEFPSGAVAATQYSSSSGGYTNPGTFPGVPDAGDSVCVPGACNPNHDWTATVPVATIDAAWPQLGVLQSIDITGRNGDGDWGGRVTAMTLVGSAQNVSMTGDTFAAALGLNSDWFTTGPSLDSPAIGMARTSDNQGYWVGGSAGGVDAFGDANFYGSAQGLSLSRPVVGMAPTHDGGGYWLVAADGGIFTYGDAGFYGSTGNIHLNQPVVGMAPTPDGGGYWLVAADGGIFTFGDATFYGSAGSLHLVAPVVGMSATGDGLGYWLVAADGGIFTYGDAPFYGSGAG